MAIIVGAFQKPTGGFTWTNIDIATHGVYLKGFETSLELAIVRLDHPGILGLFLANAVHHRSSGRR